MNSTAFRQRHQNVIEQVLHTWIHLPHTTGASTDTKSALKSLRKLVDFRMPVESTDWANPALLSCRAAKLTGLDGAHLAQLDSSGFEHRDPNGRIEGYDRRVKHIGPDRVRLPQTQET